MQIDTACGIVLLLYVYFKEREDIMRIGKKQIVMIIVLIAVLLASVFLLAPFTTSHDSVLYKSSKTTLDEKKDNVIALTAIAAGASFAVSAIPGDAGSAVADKLADLSGYFVAITIAIYIEEWMLAIMGILSFKIVVPIGCIALIVALLIRSVPVRVITLKVMLFSVVLTAVVPCSTWISQQIDRTTDESISERIEKMQKDSESDDDSKEEDSDYEESSGLFSKIKSAASSVVSSVKSLPDKFKILLSNMIDMIAAMVVTSCVIPILVFIFLVWIVNMIFGTAIRMPKPKKVSESGFFHQNKTDVITDSDGE